MRNSRKNKTGPPRRGEKGLGIRSEQFVESDTRHFPLGCGERSCAEGLPQIVGAAKAGVLRLVRLDLLTQCRCLSLPRLAFLAHYIELIARQPTDQSDLRGRQCSEFISERSQLRVARKIHPREELIGCPLNFKPSEMEKEGIPTRAKLQRSER